MSSSDLSVREDPAGNESGLGALLDSMFGYFVWAAHLLIIYIATAVSCQLGLGSAGSATRTTFLVVLALVTVAAAGAVLFHAARRYRQYREGSRFRFRMTVTVGNDAVATLAIAWQLFAISIVPLCA